MMQIRLIGREEEIINQPEIPALENDLKRQMRGIRVVKIKVYNKNGLTVFSTDPSQIGEDKSKNPGFLSALNGEVKNEISFKNIDVLFCKISGSRTHFISISAPIIVGIAFDC